MHRGTLHLLPYSMAIPILFLALPVCAINADQHAAVIAPYLDDETILVAHVDVSRIDVDAAVRMLSEFMPADGSLKKQMETATPVAKAWLAGFRKVGGRDVYASFSMAGLGHDDTPFFVLIPSEKGSDSSSLEAMVQATVAMAGSNSSPAHSVVRIPEDGPILFANDITIERLKALYAKPTTVDRRSVDTLPRITAAFDAVDNAAVQIIFMPTDDHRRVLREMFPKLPKPLDAIDGPMLADGILWKAVGIDLPPNFGVRSVVQAKDSAAAERLAAGWRQLLDFAATEPKVREHVPVIDQIVPLLQPSIEGDRVVVTMTHDSVVPIVKQMLVPAVAAARTSAQRQVRMNQFKQLAVAMHNWADAIGMKVAGKKRRIFAFPPAATHTIDGKPPLSWRVAILPYLEQSSLYDQFNLDEPWDSKHNKTLIEKMLDIYKDQELAGILGGNRIPSGYTTYVVPIGKGLVFGRKEGTALQEIKDGLSQTIMIVEVVPELAVPWTKPADWHVDLKNVLDGVKRADRPGFVAVWCDGHASFMSNDIDTKKLRALLTRAGGEVIE